MAAIAVVGGGVVGAGATEGLNGGAITGLGSPVGGWLVVTVGAGDVICLVSLSQTGIVSSYMARPVR